jgi:hypothetical protein
MNNLLVTFNRPSYLETTRAICDPADILSAVSAFVNMLDTAEKAWKITVEPTDIEYFKGELE